MVELNRMGLSRSGAGVGSFFSSGTTDMGNGWTQIAHAIAGSANTTSVTSPPIDTTGADLLIVAVAAYNVTFGADMSDSKGNFWSAGTQYNGGAGPTSIIIYYSKPSTVGTGHTFTWSQGTARFPALAVIAVSGSHASPADASTNGAGTAGATSLAPGAITPTQNNELVISAVGTAGVEGGTITQNNLTTVDVLGDAPGSALGIGLAQITQSTAASVNTTWSWTNSIEAVANIVAFKHS